MEFIVIIILVIVTLLLLQFLNTPCSENFKLNTMRPNKCFDCEAGLTDDNLAIGFPGKCIDCENQSKMPFFEGPNKSYDSEIRHLLQGNEEVSGADLKNESFVDLKLETKCLPDNYAVAGNIANNIDSFQSVNFEVKELHNDLSSIVGYENCSINAPVTDKDNCTMCKRNKLINRT